MIRSKLFSKTAKYCVAISVTGGCVGKSGGIYLPIEREPLNRARAYWTPHDKALAAIVTGSDPMEADPRRVFAAYCANGRSLRPMQTHIRAILPRPPKGIAIDTAGDVKEKVHQVFRSVAKSYYSRGTYLKDADQGQGSDGLQMLAIREASVDTFVKLAKESRATDQASVSLLAMYGNQSLFLGLVAAVPYQAVGYSGSRKDLFQWRESGAMTSSKSSLDLVFPGRPMKAEDGKVIYPLYQAIPFEIAYFQRHFTMLIPPETQRQAFGHANFFVRSDGTFDLGMAVSHRADLWDAYVASQASLKEAQTDDPQIIDFQTDLNLKLFCAYGRPVADLVTD